MNKRVTTERETEMGSWYETGYGQLETIEAARRPTADRLWVKPGGEIELVFVDDAPFWVKEHQYKIEGSWKNWLTCCASLYPDDARCCEVLGRNSREDVGYYTVIDCTAWKDKRGNTHQFEMRLLPAKFKTVEKFNFKRNSPIVKEHNDGLLSGAMFKVKRLDPKSPVCGDEYEFVRKVDMSGLFQNAMFKGKKLTEVFAAASEVDVKKMHDTFQTQGVRPASLVAFNYEKLLEPQEPKVVRDLLAGFRRDDQASGSSGSFGADTSVPF